MDGSDEIENLRRENEALKRDLKEATLQLATLAHKEYQIPDGSIRDDYEKICRAIESWIDYACSDQPGEFKIKYREALKNEDKTHNLRSIGLEFERTATSDSILDLLKKQDMLHYYILSLTIGSCIFSEILMKPYPLGTTQSQKTAFSSIEEEMLRMGKAKSKTNQWRSDTLTALCASKYFEADHQNQLCRLWEDLKEDLSYWLKSSSVSKHSARLQREIFEPAVKLHREMRCSTQQYEFISSTRDLQFEPSHTEEEAFSYFAKDIATWKTIACRDGTEINHHCIYPGLAVYNVEAEKKSELVKLVMAVNKQSLPHSAKRSTTSSANSSPHRTDPQRTDSLVKESRDNKHHKPTAGTLKTTREAMVDFFRGSRKAGDNRRSSEPASPTSRRQSRDTKSTQSRNHPLSQDQSINHPQFNQTPQSELPRASFSTYTHLPPDGTQQYENELTGEPEEIIVELEDMREEPEEMQHSANFTEWQPDYNCGRANVSDRM